ncbi:helix-turn-helix domain-containing protein [Acidocella sp.]|uniref:helix-turn-helix domain-containing protein n=1 Tax=Acidocella sp. TaxID=50710 RepID=UPI0017CC1CAB|nr:helix-turn-helix domain-containing protein [Acidocella sp.]NNM55699.1 helix-turn-helix domain-containing protein [Acidocella sp.]
MPNEIAGIDMTQTDQPQPAAQVGAGLRSVRERLGWKLPEVAEGLRIRLPYLEAIERGDLGALPGPAYQTGFIRTYAQSLGLDPEEILRRFRDAGSMGELPPAELKFLAPVPDRGVPAGAIALLGVVLLLAGYGLWYLHTEKERRMAAAVPSVPVQLAPLAVPPKPPASPATPTPATLTPATPAAAPAVAVAPAAPEPTPTAQPTTSSTAQPAATPPSQPAATPVATPVATPDNGQVILATADTWVEVSDTTGNILFSKVLHAGESWPVPDEAGLTMTVGNAGGTEIAINGKAGAPLGAVGAVLHNYALTPPAAKTAAPPAAN